MDETALPSGALGPRDLAPLIRACPELDRRDMGKGDSRPQSEDAQAAARVESGLERLTRGMRELGGEDYFANAVTGWIWAWGFAEGRGGTEASGTFAIWVKVADRPGVLEIFGVLREIAGWRGKVGGILIRWTAVWGTERLARAARDGLPRRVGRALGARRVRRRAKSGAKSGQGGRAVCWFHGIANWS